MAWWALACLAACLVACLVALLAACEAARATVALVVLASLVAFLLWWRGSQPSAHASPSQHASAAPSSARASWKGCRVRYDGPGGAALGYVSEDGGGEVVIQDPWSRSETLPIPKSRVARVRSDAIHPKTGAPMWRKESDRETKEMFDFHDLTPKDC